MAEIGGDVSSAEWKSDRPASRGMLKAPWLAKAVAKLDQKQSIKASPQRPQRNTEGKKREEQRAVAKVDQEKGTRTSPHRQQGNTEEKKTRKAKLRAS